MKGTLKLAAPFLLALGVAACSAGGGSSGLPASGQMGMQVVRVPQWLALHQAHPACEGSRFGEMQCDALISNANNPLSSPSGITAADIESAYHLPSTKQGKGQTVYVVDAYDNPDVESDFATYRSTMKLPKGTLLKYNQEGQQSNYPTGSPQWGVEIDLDVEMVSASCPLCKVALIEANSSQDSDLGAAEEEAVKLGAKIISNSYSGEGDSESYYDTKGVTYLASAGDSGYSLIDPATFKDVIAVGGTFLEGPLTTNKRGWSETVWPDTGGGCSTTQEPKPSWQHDPGCKYRTGNDIAAVGAVQVAEYDSYDQRNDWFQIGGTSVSSPLVAGIVGLAGNATKNTGGENLWKLKKKKQHKDIYSVIVGNDGCPQTLSGSYLCTAGTKQFGIYSGPDGWGTPHGDKAL